MAEINISGTDIVGAARKAGRRLEDDLSLDEGFRSLADQARILAYYMTLLSKWNKSMNLVGPRKWTEVFHSLIIDSLHLADFLNALDLPKAPVTLDLGAGAGLPGIPLRTVWQQGDYYLVESRQKRSIFMRTALRMMQLPRTEVIQGRAEKIPQEILPADLILSKAFMPWKELLPFVQPMLAKKGRIIILSNNCAPDESEVLPLGYNLEISREYKAGDKKHYFWSLLPAS
ncbi:16S rRNA (guanine(527)-N(7))-methyltransferase RsmG [Maridesulfovibrio hydrothermalis]|uniref:Ribosomal RNA small subunit methyltransferase G n=1 Tax=Maridesulfovibrio hydrothermalis AM13 = DSM 14728 TaxID=1121451 RepID=L0RAA2_9BACT|nr:16S rRNA (guanine(527)-N(7))-methyltransferase RsmG [Maridesulfovibrio hydrothermalis]CCO23120.1 Ribosomal RNA small subunit methyltransferase G [Maridesulfovibrio hydrothermalis AM13 = DSM 14728]